MKIFKKRDQSLLIKSFGIKNTLYLACTVLVYFDLENPDDPLKEQELWGTVPNELGQGGILDMGMPKPRGEVLVTGKCFAPRGTTRPASEIAVRVGAVRKRLSVFGDRFWKLTGGAQVITDPEPFREMPIVWQNASGGEGFDRNPVGKGIKPVFLPDGRTAIPLPNIEDPSHLIGSPSDRPDPAGFGPLDLMWPQRFKKQGTYDEKWQRERWPYFPDDMNYEFFNTAPEDQFLAEFFKGDETIEILNMHPDIQVINSHLPRVRVRCFVTKKKDPKMENSEDDIFQEVETHIDTVWLFPHLLRGVVMHRGTTEIQDEDYGDLRWIFLDMENTGEDPRPIEYYLDEQKKVLQRKVNIDPAPFEAAQKKIGDALKRVKAIPKEVEEAKKRAMGKAPRMDYSAQEIVAGGKKTLAENRALLDKLEAQTREMHARYGHLVKIDLTKFDAIREKLGATGQKIDKTLAEVEKGQAKAADVKKEVAQAMKERIDPAHLEKAGVDPDNLLKPVSVNPWHDRGFPMVIQYRKNLEHDRAAMGKLHRLGLNRHTIRRAWLGINPEGVKEDRPLWGLEEKKGPQGQPESMGLPAGLVMPRFHGPTLNRIQIRKGADLESGQDVLIEGSDETPLFLTAVEDEDAPVVRVADELEARYVEQEIGGACSVIALKGADEKPDDEASKAIEAASVFLVVAPEGGIPDREWETWKKAFPNARPLPLPKGRTIFEARRQGGDIRNWIMKALPKDFAGKHRVEPVMPEPGQPPAGSPVEGLAIPGMDIQGMVNSLTKEIRGSFQPHLDKAVAMKKEMEETARKAILRTGEDPEKVIAAGKALPKPSMSGAGKMMADKIIGTKDKIADVGQMTPEIEQKLNDATAQVKQMAGEWENQYQEGMTKAKAAEEEAAKVRAGGIPDDVKARLKSAGVDTDKVKKLTREEVIERHEKGESLEGAILSGLDLSKLDLRGIDLSGAQCRKTKFCESNLEGALFTQTLAQEADFTRASLKDAKSERGLFSKALFKEANLSGADFHMSVLQEADLTKADCSGIRINMTILQRAKLNNTRISNSDLQLCVFTEADASDADFEGTRLFKCLFRKTLLDRVNFSGAALDSTMLFEAKGTDVRFQGADMTRSRMGQNTSLPGADFRDIKMVHGCFRDSDLSGASFRGSEIEMSMVENCDLQGADFYLVPAKRTRFSKSNLEGADMRGINLFQGSLRKSRLVKADIRGSNLFAVDFYKAVLGDTRLDDANLKMTLLHGRTEYLE